MQQLLSAVHDVHPRRSRPWLVLFHPSHDLSALTFRRQDGLAAGCPLFLRTLAITWPQFGVGENKNHVEAAQLYGIVSDLRATDDYQV